MLFLIFETLILKISHLNFQNNTLIQLRDTLLPKLMNGEINLDKIEIQSYKQLFVREKKANV